MGLCSPSFLASCHWWLYSSRSSLVLLHKPLQHCIGWLLHKSSIVWLPAEISRTSLQSWSESVALMSNAEEAGGGPLLTVIADGNPGKEKAGDCLNHSQQEEIKIHPTVVNVPWRKEGEPLASPKEVSRRDQYWKLGQSLILASLALNSLHTAVWLFFFWSSLWVPSCLALPAIIITKYGPDVSKGTTKN